MIFPTLPRRREACPPPHAFNPAPALAGLLILSHQSPPQTLPFYKPQQPLLVFFFFNPFILI